MADPSPRRVSGLAYAGPLDGDERIPLTDDPSGSPTSKYTTPEDIAALAESEGGGGSGEAFEPSAANLYAAVLQLLEAGANVTITGDGTDGITIAASGGGGGSSFVPSQSNIYDAVKAILQAGSQVTITPNDGNHELTLASTASGGGTPFSPTQQNIYDAVKAILQGAANVTITPDDANSELDISASGGGSSFVPSQSNIYDAVKAIIVGGTDDDAAHTITLPAGGSSTPAEVADPQTIGFASFSAQNIAVGSFYDLVVSAVGASGGYAALGTGGNAGKLVMKKGVYTLAASITIQGPDRSGPSMSVAGTGVTERYWENSYHRDADNAIVIRRWITFSVDQDDRVATVRVENEQTHNTLQQSAFSLSAIADGVLLPAAASGPKGDKGDKGDPGEDGGGLSFTWLYPSAAQDTTANGRPAETVWPNTTAGINNLIAAVNALSPSDGDFIAFRVAGTTSDFVEVYQLISDRWTNVKNQAELDLILIGDSGNILFTVAFNAAKGQHAESSLPPGDDGFPEWNSGTVYPQYAEVRRYTSLYIRLNDGAADGAVNPDPASYGSELTWAKVGGLFEWMQNPDTNATEIGGFKLTDGAFGFHYEFADRQARADIANIVSGATPLTAAPQVPEWVQNSAYAAGRLVSYHGRVWRCVTALATSTTNPADSNHWSPVGAWSGTWSNTRRYALGNWVAWQGHFYIASRAVTGGLTPPLAPNDWYHLAPDLHGFRGVWAAGTAYAHGDLVFQSDHFYRCTNTAGVTSNMGPVADTANWDPAGTYHDDWVNDRRYEAGDMVRHGTDNAIWIAPATITAGQPEPGADGAAWRRIDDPGNGQSDVEAWALIGATVRIPRERQQPPTAGLSGENVRLNYGAQGVDLPRSQVGASPDADRPGTMSTAQVRKLQDLVKITPRGTWVGNQREYAVGDLVHRVYENHTITAYSLAAHSSTTANGPTVAGNATWATLAAVPVPDWDAASPSAARIRNKPTIPDPHTITEQLLAFDTAGIHSGYGADYWHRTNVLASAIPANAEVCFELPYTWTPPPRFWSRWVGAPTQVATEWWLQDFTVPDSDPPHVVDRIPAPTSSFTLDGGTHYHPFGFIDTSEHPRAVEIKEVALIVDGGGYLCFCTQGIRPTVGDPGSTARAAGIRILWRTL